MMRLSELRIFVLHLFAIVISVSSCSKVGVISFKSRETQSGINKQLRLSGPASLTAGTCSEPFKVFTQVSPGNLPLQLTSATPIEISPSGEAKVFLDSACTQAIKSVPIAEGKDSAQFYIRSTTAGNAIVKASDGPDALADTSFEVLVKPGAVNRIALSGSGTIIAGACSPYKLSSADEFGNPAPAVSGITVSLKEGGRGLYYSDSSCATPITSLLIAPGKDLNQFFFRNTAAESIVLKAETAPIPSATLGLVVAPAPASKLVFFGPQPGNLQTFLSGSCTGAFKVEAQDVNNNPSKASASFQVSLANTVNGNPGNATFHSDANCLNSIVNSRLSIVEGTTSATFYMKNAVSEILTVTGTAMGPMLTAGSIGVRFSPSQLAIEGSTQYFTRQLNEALCSGEFNLRTLDANNTSANVFADTPVILAGAGSGMFYSDSTCQTAIANGSVVITNGTNLRTVYYKASTPQTLALSASLTLSDVPVVAPSRTVVVSNPGVLSILDDSQALTQPGPYNFGPIALGSSASKILFIKNTGGFKVGSLNQVTNIPAAPFQYTGGAFPGTGGTCAINTEIQPNQSCTVSLSFILGTGALLQAYASQIGLTYNNGRDNVSVTRDLLGSAVTPALLSLNDGMALNFGSVVIESSKSLIVSVQNLGGAPATGLSGTLNPPYSYKGGSFPGELGTCQSTLPPGQSCSLVFTFLPTMPVLETFTYPLSYDDGVATRTASLNITGLGLTPAFIEISEDPIFDFGNRAVNTSTEKLFTITNNGGAKATNIAPVALALGFTFTGGTFPGTGGTCANELQSTETCIISVTFTPVAPTFYVGALAINYNDGRTLVQKTRPIVGFGLSPANLVITPSPNFNFNSRAVGSQQDQVFVVTNAGNLTASAMNSSGSTLLSPLTFKDGLYPGTGGTCGSILIAGANCTIIVNFSPTTIGASSGNLLLQYNDALANRMISVALSGNAVTPGSLSISDAPEYYFGSLAVGSILYRTFRVTNNGGFVATALSPNSPALPFSFRGDAYPGTGGDCGSSLAAGASCDIVIKFSPQSIGIVESSLSLSYNDGVILRSSSVSLQGSGISPASLSISDTPRYDFGNTTINTSRDHTFIVSNSGQALGSSLVVASLTPPFSFKGGTYPGIGGTCSTNLSGGGTCSIVVTYAPTSAGEVIDSLRLTYLPFPDNGNGTPTPILTTREMRGVGIRGAILTFVDASPLTLPNQIRGGTTVVRTLEVHNIGELTATSIVSTLTSSSPDVFRFVGGAYPGGGNCGTSLAAAASCTLSIEFSSTGAGNYSGTLKLDYNNSVEIKNVSLSLLGTVITPASLTLNSASGFDFGMQIVGASPATRRMTLSNSGEASATLITFSPLSSGFSFINNVGNCGATLNGGATCNLDISFSPASSGDKSSELRVDYHDGIAGRLVSQILTGMGRLPALLNISNAPTFDFGNVLVGDRRSHVFTVLNSGETAATVSVAPSLNAPFSVLSQDCMVSPILPNQTCSITVEYAPSSNVLSLATLPLSYNNGLNSLIAERPLSGKGVNPSLITISDSPAFDFGTQEVNSVTSKDFTLANSGDIDATLVSLLAVTSPFSLTNSCGASLPSNASCSVRVSFSPTAANTYNDSVRVTYFNGLSNQTGVRTFSGTAVNPAVILFTEAPTFDFGNKIAGTTHSQTFTLRNTGGVSATSITTASITGPFSILSQNCSPGPLMVNSTCVIQILLTTPSTPGPFTGVLSFSYVHRPGAIPVNVSLNLIGDSDSKALLSISNGPTFTFPNTFVGSIASQIFTVTNSGETAANSLSRAALPLPFSYGPATTCGTTLASFASCSVEIQFTPTQGITYSETFSLSYNDGVAVQNSQIGIRGLGIRPALLTFDIGSSFDFGTRMVSSTFLKTIVVTNTGNMTASAITNTSTLTSPFSFSGGSYPGGGSCGASLAGNTSCTLVIEFSPIVAGNFSGSLSLRYDNGNSFATTSASITGVGATGSILTLSESDPYDFGTKLAPGGAIDHVFNVTNTGGRIAMITSPSINTIPAATVAFQFKGNLFPGTGGTCTFSIAVGQSCTIIGSFVATITGTFNGEIALPYNDDFILTTRIVKRTLKGTSVATPILTISDPNFNYGSVTVNSTVDKLFQVSNNGSTNITSITAGALSPVFNFKGGIFPGTGGNCGTTLAGGASCDIMVSFAPATAGGPFSQNIVLKYFDGIINVSATRSIIGTGLLVGQGSFAPAGSIMATWNPLDKALNVAISNANLTANTPVGSFQDSVRATVKKVIWKWYFEVTVNRTSSDTFGGIGTATQALNLEQYAGQFDVGCAYHHSGQVQCNKGVFTTLQDPYRTTDVIGVAVDIGLKRVYYSRNGIWQLGSNPSNGTGGLPSGFDTANPAFYPTVSLSDGAESTANFGQVPFRYGVPTGFAKGYYDQMAPAGTTIATWNPTDKAPSILLSVDRLTASDTLGSLVDSVRGTLAKNYGKWYYEVQITSLSGDPSQRIGTTSNGLNLDTGKVGETAPGCGYNANGFVFCNSKVTPVVTYANYVPGDVIGVAMDVSMGRVYFSKNGVWQGASNPDIQTGGVNSGIAPDFFPAITLSYRDTSRSNFGNQPFFYPVPAGFRPGVYVPLPGDALSTTWNPNRIGTNSTTNLTPALTLSNGNLTVTKSGGDTEDRAVQAISGAISSKWYYEVKIVKDSGNIVLGWTADTNLMVRPGFNTPTGCGYRLNGDLHCKGVNAGNGGRTVAGQTVGIAVDLGFSKMWVRLPNGSWHGALGTDPATNTGGYNMGLPSSPARFFPTASIRHVGDQFETNFGAQPFIHPIPAGFNAGVFEN